MRQAGGVRHRPPAVEALDPDRPGEVLLQVLTQLVGAGTAVLGLGGGGSKEQRECGRFVNGSRLPLDTARVEWSIKAPWR